MPGPQDLAETYVTAETLDDEVEGWLAEIRACQWREVGRFRAESAALLVVDMTRPFVEEGQPLASPNARAIVPRVAELVEGFRAARRPVLWIVQGHHSVEYDRGAHLSSWWPAPLLEGAGDTEMASGLAAAAGEKVIVKRRYSGFYQTDLECTLRCLEIGQVVICGVLTNVCPCATAFDAFMRDFRIYWPADGTASLNRELHVSGLRTVAGWCGHVVRARDVIGWLAA